ncbi:fungal-specific transcription factor domain-containing protein [Crucibulum laeve]|uniref:Fungal-specific transcription factor domain-containing protein n=1 Tax=Crucibulum laeve TaxID=68775 RepID=A0A5C3LJL6_9AGAR|nr:fungal-specific transcription factor domain-containing protein [Crucibulum laeve]
MNVESKNSNSDASGSRKVGLSCAECRRSKLKCDRVFPCQSCIRRGCAGICPEGTLAATKGNKVLMAHAQRLSEQVKALTSRVHELEEALGQTHSKDDSTHSLLQPSVTSNGDPEAYDECVQDVSEAIGSLSLGVDGQAKYHGESASSEYFQDLLPPAQEEWLMSAPKHLDLPQEIINLLNAFPFGLKDNPYSRFLFIPYLPTRERAMELTELYYINVAWMYDPIIHQDFVNTILDPIYGTTGYANLNTLHSHRLALFFILLANGVLYDTHPSAVPMAKQFHALARAALSLDSILVEATCATVQALFLMFRFIYNSDRSSNEERWLLTGLCARLAQTIGLQRDSAGWNLPPDEIQRRRRLFWELFVWDSWSGVVNGRPAALMIQHTDCQFPDDLDPAAKATGELDLGWHAWKFRYAATCLIASAQHVFSTKTPPYSALLDIDKRIRKFPMPSHLRSPVRVSEAGRSWSTDPSRAMQQYCALCLRESNLLYIHRSYFAQAIRQDPENPLRHKYAPSVLATYRSACRLISSLRGLYPIHPRISSHSWYFWSGIFSSCIVLGALVVESPGCTLARDALRELESTLPFYEEGSRPCRAPTTVTILQKLCQRASAAYAAFKAGVEDGARQGAGEPGKPDELEVLGGRKSVITPSSNANSPSNTASSPTPLHIEAEDSNSPESHAGAAEMLIEYYQALGNPGFEIHKRQDYDMEVPHYANDDSYKHQHPTSMAIEIPNQYMDHQYTGDTGMHPDANQEYASPHQGYGHIHPDTKQHPQVWHAAYQAPQHPSHPHHPSVSPPQSLVYGPPAPPMDYRYPQEVQPNQDEIWRNFMLKFSGPN